MNDLKEAVIAALRTVFDPEIPLNIYDLGLIYALDVDQHSHDVYIRMTLTAAACPVAQSFPDVVAETVEQVDGVHDVTVELVWEPPWAREMISEAGLLELGML
jgi:FeS assembly SUF system protein